MFETVPLDREAAVRYARKWAFKRNPRYLDFHGLGGDCTNFVSQCLYAGGANMNYTPVYGWYYISADNRTASWTGVEYLYNFLTQNEGEGPFAVEAELSEAQPGDVIQLGDFSGHFYHSLLVVATGRNPSMRNIRIATHTDDAFNRPLASYSIAQYRLLHIQGIRRTV